MREIILSKREAHALAVVKRFFIDECKIPSASQLAERLGSQKTWALYVLQGLSRVGVLRRNRCGGWRFTYRPYSIKIIS